MAFDRGDFLKRFIEGFALVRLPGADQQANAVPRELLEFLSEFSQGSGHRLRAGGPFVPEEIAVLEPDGFAAAKEGEGLQGFAKFAQRLERLTAIVNGGINDFVVQAAQLGTPLLIDLFGALLDGEF